MSNTYYRQCRLEKGTKIRVAWIPEQFAKKGKYLKLRIGVDRSWDDGWCVESVGPRQSEEILGLQEQSYRSHRSVTDI